KTCRSECDQQFFRNNSLSTTSLFSNSPKEVKEVLMANEQASTPVSTLDIRSVLAELEVPFSPDQVQWRVTNTAKDKKRGQIVPYADPRAYADRLNALFTPQGWTREYKIETMSNITRMKKGESIVSGKILVACTVTIIGLWS